MLCRTQNWHKTMNSLALSIGEMRARVEAIPSTTLHILQKIDTRFNLCMECDLTCTLFILHTTSNENRTVELNGNQ